MEEYIVSNFKFNQDKFKQVLIKFLDNTSDKQIQNTTALTMGPGYYFWYSSIYLANVIEEIIEDPKLGKLFSWKELGELILSLIGKGKAADKKNEQIFENILQQITKSPNRFFCIIPFHGINLTKSYPIGNVTLYPASEKQSVLNKNVSSDLCGEIMDSLTDHQNFATVSVDAVIEAGAIETALSEVKSALNILKFLMNTPTSIYQIGVGKQNQTMFDNEFVAVTNDRGTTQHPFQYMPTPASLSDIQQPGKDYINRIGKIQSKIYTSQKIVPLERGLANATSLIADSLNYEEPNIQLTQLMSAIEALVEQKTFVQGITDQVCERSALLLGKDLISRKKIYSKLTSLYGKRSNLSHGDTAVVTHYDVVYLWEIARNLCFYFQLNFDKFLDSNQKEKKNLKTYLLDLRFEINRDSGAK